MEIEYDKKADAKYIRIKKGKISSTQKMQSWLFLDCALGGDVLGVEVLDASRHLISVLTVGGEFIGITESKLLDKGETLGLTADVLGRNQSSKLALV